MSYLIWIPTLILLMVMQAYLSYKNNLTGGMWFWLLTITGIVPLWSIISRISKNFVSDGLLYDIILLISYNVTVILLTKGYLTYNFVNYVGLVLIIAGFVLFNR